MSYSRRGDRFNKAWWWEPRWASRPALVAEFKTMLRPGLWLRVWSLSSVAAWMMWLVTRDFLLPGEFPWLPAAGVIFLLMPVYLAFAFVMYWFLPNQIVFTKHGLVIGKHHTPAKEIEDVRLIRQGGMPRLLAVCTSKRARLVGLPSEVDPTELRRCLEDLFPRIPLENFN